MTKALRRIFTKRLTTFLLLFGIILTQFQVTIIAQAATVNNYVAAEAPENPSVVGTSDVPEDTTVVIGSSGPTYSTAAAMNNYVAAGATTAPVIDGQLNDNVWVPSFETYTDPATGKSMQFKYAFDQNNLYVAGKYTDSTLTFDSSKIFIGDTGATSSSKYVWDYDDIGLYISPTNSQGSYQGNDVQFMFTYQDDGKPALRVGSATTSNQKTNYNNGVYDIIDSACSSTTAGWNFEAAIPFSTLGISSPVGATFGIGMTQTDTNSDFTQVVSISDGAAKWNSFAGSNTLTFSSASADYSKKAYASFVLNQGTRYDGIRVNPNINKTTDTYLMYTPKSGLSETPNYPSTTSEVIVQVMQTDLTGGYTTTRAIGRVITKPIAGDGTFGTDIPVNCFVLGGDGTTAQEVINSLNVGDMIEYIPATGANAVDSYQLSDQTLNNALNVATTPYWVTISTPSNGSYTIPIDKVNDSSGPGSIALAGPYGTYALYTGDAGINDSVAHGTVYSYRIGVNASGDIVYYGSWGTPLTTVANLNSLGVTTVLVIKLKATDTGVATYQPAPTNQGAFAQELEMIVGYSAVNGGSDTGAYTGVIAAAAKAGSFTGFSVTVSHPSLTTIKLPNGGIGITEINPTTYVPNKATAANKTAVYTSAYGTSVTTPDSTSDVLVVDSAGNVLQNSAAGSSQGTYSIPSEGYVVVSNMGSSYYTTAFTNTFLVGTTATVDETSMQITSSITKANLDAIIAVALALKESDYTPDSWASMQTALTAAQTVASMASPTQSEIETAFTALSNAIMALVSISEAGTVYDILNSGLSWSNPAGATMTKNTNNSIAITNLHIDSQDTVGWPSTSAMIPASGWSIPIKIHPYLYLDVTADPDATVNDWNISLSNGIKSVNLDKIFNEAAHSDAHGSQKVRIDLTDPNFADITSGGVINIKTVTLQAVTEQYRMVTFNKVYISGLQQSGDTNSYNDPVKLPAGVGMEHTEVQTPPEYGINLGNNAIVKGTLNLNYTTENAGQLDVKLDGQSIDGTLVTKKPVLSVYTYGLNPSSFPYNSVLSTSDGGTTWNVDGSFQEASTGSTSFWLTSPEQVRLSNDLHAGVNELRIVPSNSTDYFKLGVTPFGTANLNDIQVKNIRLIMPNGAVYSPTGVNKYTPVAVGDTDYTETDDIAYEDNTAYAFGDGYPAGSSLSLLLALGLQFNIDPSDLTPVYDNNTFSVDTTTMPDGPHTLTLYFNGSVVKTVNFTVSNNPTKLANSPTYDVVDSTFDSGKKSYTLGLGVNSPLDDKMNVNFYKGKLFSVSGKVTTDNGTSELNHTKINALSSTISNIITNTSSTVPSHEFDVNVGSYKGNVILSYKGNTKPGETIRFSVYNPTTSNWEAQGQRQTSIQNSFVIDTAKYASNGIIKAKADLVYVDNGADTFIWFSDPQFYTDFAGLAHFYSDVTNFAVSKYQSGEIGYFITTGDLVNQNITSNWQVADTAQRILDDAGVPNGVVAGNHDVGNHSGTPGDYDSGDYTNYQKYFGESRYINNAWYGGSLDDNTSHYDLVTIGGKDFIFLYLGMGHEASTETVNWANAVLSKYKDRNAIIGTHEYLSYTGKDYVDTYGNNATVGKDIYDKIVVPNSNVVMVLCGHEPGAITRVTNVAGTDRNVIEMLACYQVVDVSHSQTSTDNNYRSNGDGFVRLMTIDGNNLNFTTYSPSINNYNAFAPEVDTGTQTLNLQAPSRQLTTTNFTATAVSSTPVKTLENQSNGNTVSGTLDMSNETPGTGLYASIEDSQGHITYSPVFSWTSDAAIDLASKTAAIPDYLPDYLAQTNDSNVTITLAGSDTVSKDIFKSAKENGKRITFNIVDSEGKTSYQWTYDGKTIIKSDADINLGLNFSSPNQSRIQALTRQSGLFHMSFAYHGTLSGPAQLKVYVGNKYKDGDKIYLYYYNTERNTVELQGNGITVSDGYADFTITHCSDYFFTAKKVSGVSNSNDHDDAGNDENTDNSDNQSNPGNIGSSSNPSDSENTDDSSNPSNSGNAGSSNDPSDSGNSSEPSKSSDSGSSSDLNNSSDSGNSGDSNNSGNHNGTSNEPQTQDSANWALYAILSIVLAGVIILAVVVVRLKRNHRKNI